MSRLSKRLTVMLARLFASETEQIIDENTTRFAEVALKRHKRQGMRLAVAARWVALAIIAVMLPLTDPRASVIYYEVLLVALGLNGWAQLRVARVGRSRPELLLIILDLSLMTAGIVIPNPLADSDWPLAMQFRTEAFRYFYVILAFGTLAYSSRTVWGIGVLTTMLWGLAVAGVWLMSGHDSNLTDAANAAFSADPLLADFLDPNNLLYNFRIQDAVVFLIVAGILSISSRLFGRLLRGHSALERERANLARYFSPNVVEELSHNDDPLKQMRTQDIAVLFVDIVGFTRFAAARSAQDVIATLRAFHLRMETEVFRHHGTLDKYLGDGLMATFGTPVAGQVDALNALNCARAMIASVGEWNVERRAAGEPVLNVGFGLHYGPAVLGDIGSNRLEFAVIGNTVNVASRVEALTRSLSVDLAATDDLMHRARQESGGDGASAAGFERRDGQEIRGLDDTITVWTLKAAA